MRLPILSRLASAIFSGRKRHAWQRWADGQRQLLLLHHQHNTNRLENRPCHPGCSLCRALRRATSQPPQEEE